MSNEIKNYEKYARSIDMNLEEFDELTRRMTGFFKNNPMNQATVKKSFLAALDIQTRSKKEIAQKWITTNKVMREFGADIARLTKDGLGGQRIIKELGLKASRGTVEKFCKDNNLVSGVKNG